MNKKIVIGIVLVVSIVVSVFFLNGKINNVAERINYQPPTQQEKYGGVSSPSLASNYWCVNEVCHYYYSGSFVDATNTLAAIANPLRPVYTNYATTTGATTTLISWNVNVTSPSTTTQKFMMGTSTVASLNIAKGSTEISESLINATLATSSTAFYSDVVTGAIPTGGTAASGAFTQIQLAPLEYLVIYASSTNDAEGDYNGGIVGNSNTFSGTYSFEFIAPRR